MFDDRESKISERALYEVQVVGVKGIRMLFVESWEISESLECISDWRFEIFTGKPGTCELRDRG
jgi:hypothetical protein